MAKVAHKKGKVSVGGASAVIIDIRMNITEKLELSGGITILACNGYNPKFSVIGKQFRFILGDEMRQTLTISGERKLLNQQEKLDQRAFETRDTVELSSGEARSGECLLVSN